MADFRVNVAGRIHAGPATHRQLGDARFGALIEHVCTFQAPADHQAYSRRKHRISQPRIGINPGFLKPLGGQVDAASPRILSDIPADIGQLHRDAEITSTCQFLRRRLVHQCRHHQPDRSGHPDGVGFKGRKVFIPAAIRVPFEPFNQCFGPCLWDREILDHPREGLINVRPDGVTGIGSVEALPQAADRLLPARA